jgi:hypothetical protein
MKRTLASLILLGLIPAMAPAIEIKNVRPSYGPLGPARTVTKFLPGDVVFMTYDIHALAVDKTGKAVYETKLEFLDAKEMQLFERKTPNEVIPSLAGARMPGDLHLIIGKDFNPGKHTVRLTVTDKLANKSASLVYAIEVLPKGLGFIGVLAPAVGLTGQSYVAEWGLVGFVPDAKTKLPKVDIAIRVLDQNDKPVVPETKILLPNDLPLGAGADKMLELVPLSFPLQLNRPGQFYLDIVAIDKNGKNAQVHMRVPLTVVDIGTITGGK